MVFVSSTFDEPTRRSVSSRAKQVALPFAIDLGIAIQEISQRIAAGISGGRLRPLHKTRSELATILDRIFLSFLKRHPKAAPEVFFNLFKRVPPHHLIPFLSDKPDLLDMAKVIFAMPSLPFIQEAFHSMRAKGVPV